MGFFSNIREKRKEKKAQNVFTAPFSGFQNPQEKPGTAKLLSSFEKAKQREDKSFIVSQTKKAIGEVPGFFSSVKENIQERRDEVAGLSRPEKFSFRVDNFLDTQRAIRSGEKKDPIVSVGQEILAGAGTVGKTVLRGAFGKKLASDENLSTGEVGQTLFGREPEPAQNIAARITDRAEDFGASKFETKLAAALGFSGFLAIESPLDPTDLIGSIGKTAFNGMVEVTTKEAAEKILRKELSETVIDTIGEKEFKSLADDIAKSQTDEELEAAFRKRGFKSKDELVASAQSPTTPDGDIVPTPESPETVADILTPRRQKVDFKTARQEVDAGGRVIAADDGKTYSLVLADGTSQPITKRTYSRLSQAQETAPETIVTPEVDSQVVQTPDTPTQSNVVPDSLVDEAKKYDSAEDFVNKFFVEESYDMTPGSTRIADTSETGLYHGAGITNLKSILTDGNLRTGISKLDNLGEKTLSASGNRSVANSYGVVFELDDSLPKRIAPKGAVQGDVYDAFEYRIDTDVPLSKVKNVTIPLNKGDGLDTQILWNYKGKTPEYITAEELAKQFETKGIKVFFNDGSNLTKSQLTDIWKGSQGNISTKSIAETVGSDTSPSPSGTLQEAAKRYPEYEDFEAAVKRGEENVLPFYSGDEANDILNPRYDQIIERVKKAGFEDLRDFWNKNKDKRPTQATASQTTPEADTVGTPAQDQKTPRQATEVRRREQKMPKQTKSKSLETYSDTIAYQPQDVNEAQDFFMQFEHQDTPPTERPVFHNLVNAPDMLTDISSFTGETRDFFRNVETVFKNKIEYARSMIIDPFDDAKGKYVDYQQELADEMKTEIVEKLKIKPGSKESAAIMDYGERNLKDEFAPARPLSENDLVLEFGRDRANDIIAADKWFRDRYDTLIDQINAERKEIYSTVWKKKDQLDEEIKLLQDKLASKDAEIASKKRTDTLAYIKLQYQKQRLGDAILKRRELVTSEMWWRGKLIPKRNDYYRHYQEMAEGFNALKNILTEDAKISSQLSGISPFTKPKSKFLQAAQKRLGNTSRRDAIGGFANYIPSASYAIYIDPQIAKFRQLAKELADATSETKNVNNFIENLHDFANHLAGKSNPADRYIQKVLGRKAFRALNWVNNRIKANVILSNLSSSVAQIFNVPQGVAATKQHAIGGMKRSMAQIFTENKAMKESTFIKERFSTPVADQFKEGMLYNVKKMAVWVTGALDEVGTKYIWNSFYQKAISEGIENPVRYADNWTRKMVAGRGVGEKPLLQNAALFQLAAPFQLEVGNLWWTFQDAYKEGGKKGLLGNLAVFAVTAYLMNRAAEEIRGNDVVFDPIQATIDGIKAFAGEQNKVVGTAKLFGRLAGEVLSNVPLGQTAAAAYPQDGFKRLGILSELTREELFGDNDPTRFGGGLLAAKGLQDPIFKLALPFGGEQVKKTQQGITSFLQGEVKNKSGDTAFNVEKTPINAAQMFIFGKYSTQAAQDYFKTLDSVYSIVDRVDKDRVRASAEAEKEFAKIQKAMDKDGKDAAKQMLLDLAKKDAELAESVSKVWLDSLKGLTGEDRAIKQMGVQDGTRARYLYTQIEELKTKEETVAYLKELNDKGLVNDTVAEQLAEMLVEEKPVYKEGQKMADGGVIDTAFLYAKAIGTDPVTAFSRIFTGQKIRRIDNGAIIVERMPFEKSQNIRARNDADDSVRLDHTIPLQLGGGNTKNNLELVPTEDWAAYTPVENYLGDLLRSGKIKKKEAQRLIAAFKNGEVSFEDIQNITSE